MDAYSFLEQLFFPNIKLYFVALFISQLFLLPLYLRRVSKGGKTKRVNMWSV